MLYPGWKDMLMDNMRFVVYVFLLGASVSLACQCLGKSKSIEEKFCSCLVAFTGEILTKDSQHVLSDYTQDHTPPSLPEGVEVITPPAVPSDFEVHYKVKVKEVFKDTTGWLKERLAYLVTSQDPDMCGQPDLIQHETYLFELSSDSGEVNFCDGFYTYSTISYELLSSLKADNNLCQNKTVIPT